jgi:hypothetical protein
VEKLVWTVSSPRDKASVVAVKTQTNPQPAETGQGGTRTMNPSGDRQRKKNQKRESVSMTNAKRLNPTEWNRN